MKDSEKPMADCSDRELLRRYRKGDNAAFELMIERSSERMYRTAFAVLGEPDVARQAVAGAVAEARRSLKHFHGNGLLMTRLCALVIAHCRRRPWQKPH